MSLAIERRAARERALGLLYEAEAKGITGSEVLAGLPLEPDDFAAALVNAVDEHRERIDELLSRFAKGWTLGRMPALDRAALRMGTAELIARHDVPTGVVLSEVVELASRFSTDGSGRFVNGLLARVADEVRPAGGLPGDEVPLDADDDVPPAPQVDGLIIDLDGVIRHWDQTHHDEAEARLGLPAGSIPAMAMENDRLERVTDGRLSFEAWCEEVGREMAAAHGVPAQEVSDVWATATWQIDLGMVELIEAVRAVVPVALLSNASTHLVRDLELSGITDTFDAVVGSAELGVGKPSARAFQAAADRLGVPLERCLFVDDTASHVDAAQRLGMRAAVFTGEDDLRALVTELGLLP
jgi:putative hydrolase of the HAD superfamily